MQDLPPLSAKVIRQQALAARAHLTAEQILEYSHAIVKKIKKHQRFLQSEKIGLYYPSPDEVTLLELLSETNKQFYLPRILANTQLCFMPYKHGDPLIPNHYGILEPESQQIELSAMDLDLIFVPLVAFDAEGHRLGRGKGYYDRHLSYTRGQSKRPYLLGPAFECQRVTMLPQEPHDIPLDEIVTECLKTPS